ncbi:hypothetical protein MBM_08109 [Drepanopeziza brunnea f. sp. 'multigermtubi' MB_m1]|uniref:Uncharacterized protein n=1 Tax=Marssonina brunnea f. sp. multigermtubi (strain MB_m1) TaxID=1072389 RepID=K1WZ39_MARBU|nr:uncharacterized protein MBM_08109 [Drepanopeziza brunnea f. sp. 'multigermtubi' MB_m1]EKD13908.1 hypothetical protein MBM_08109 [Drepanopeziza brunnea f. sp. 'multigermtubi' MB_m1]
MATPATQKPQTPKQIMLLTKRLTVFLSQNTSPALPTLLLLSPTGKLLSSSSPSPASTLRTQATLACSLWMLYQPTTSLLPSALPSSHTSTHAQLQTGHGGAQGREGGSSSSGAGAGAGGSTAGNPDRERDVEGADDGLSTVTIQLSNGVMIIRSLSCGLLFVAIGPAPASAAGTAPGTPSLNAAQGAGVQQIALSRHASPSASPPGDEEGREREVSGLLAVGSAVMSDAGSIRSSSTIRTGGLLGIKRQAMEVGRWLDGQLEGFRLGSAEGR